MIDIPANWMEKIQNIDWSKVEASVKDYGPAIKVLQQTWSKESLLEISQGKLFVPDSVINDAIAKKIPEGGSVTGVTVTSHANGRLDIRAETKKVGPVELSGEIQEFVHNGDTSYMKYRVRSRNIPEHGLMSWVFSRVSLAMAERMVGQRPVSVARRHLSVPAQHPRRGAEGAGRVRQAGGRGLAGGI